MSLNPMVEELRAGMPLTQQQSLILLGAVAVVVFIILIWLWKKKSFKKSILLK